MKTTFTKFDKLMAAVAFAEENEHATARQFLKEETRPQDRATARPELSKRPSIRKSR